MWIYNKVEVEVKTYPGSTACSLVGVFPWSSVLLGPAESDWQLLVPLWGSCASSKSSLKRSFWARSLQPALRRLPPPLLLCLQARFASLACSGWQWASCVIRLGRELQCWMDSSRFRLCVESFFRFLVLLFCPFVWMVIGGSIWSRGFTGSRASSACIISSSSAREDSPNGNTAPPPYESKGVSCQTSSAQGSSRKLQQNDIWNIYGL